MFTPAPALFTWRSAPGGRADPPGPERRCDCLRWPGCMSVETNAGGERARGGLVLGTAWGSGTPALFFPAGTRAPSGGSLALRGVPRSQEWLLCCTVVRRGGPAFNCVRTAFARLSARTGDVSGGGQNACRGREWRCPLTVLTCGYLRPAVAGGVGSSSVSTCSDGSLRSDGTNGPRRRWSSARSGCGHVVARVVRRPAEVRPCEAVSSG